MREVNFSIPNVNKASVGITTALYDRRALDCTSTLPLINSLNHLAYLTTSSARIRDILTVDGGVERLVCILKEGRSSDIMTMWKWNLAFQCVVNIGVRGSENVRTRVVEADMVPVIATILDNYAQVTECFRSKAEANSRRLLGGPGGSLRIREPRAQMVSAGFFDRLERPASTGDRPHRRGGLLNPIEIPTPFSNSLSQDTPPISPDSAIPLTSIHSTTETITPSRPRHNRSNSDINSYHTSAFSHANNTVGGFQQRNSALIQAPTIDISETFGFRPVRDIDRLPSMLSGFQGTMLSQPESPTTPNPSLRMSRSSTRPSIRHHRSMSGDSDEAIADEVASNTSGGPESGSETIVNLQPGVVNVRTGDAAVLETDETAMSLEPPTGTDDQEAETFNITHISPIDGSIVTPSANGNAALGFSPVPPTAATVTPVIQPPNFPRYVFDNSTQPVTLPNLPRDDDILMSLQLLAYVSKYTNLRSYFHKSHLVPNLSITSEMHMLRDGDGSNTKPEPPCALVEEYLLPDDFNIFPLVEKFTMRSYHPEMQYWAGVVMRNLCRKDDSRGGIRQCAYFQCGKWEEYTRQFAKCRRCRRTKYCSKDCQKNAWTFHRHWCVAAQP